MISRYGSHAPAAGALPGGGHGVFAAVQSVDTTSLLAGFDGSESVDTPPAVAGFDGSPTCRGALMAIEAARRYAPAVSRRIHVAASIFVLKCGPRSWRTKIGGENLPTEDAAR